MTGTRVETTVPSGPDAVIAVELDTIGVGVGDRYCIAHRQWMTREQLVELQRVVAGLLR